MKKKLLFSCFLIPVFTGVLFIPEVNAQWAPLGSPGISPSGLSNWQHLEIDASNNVYVSFNDEGGGVNASQGTVMRYDGTSWTPLGSPGFTPGISHHSSFCLGPNGTAFYSFADGDDMSKAAVMKYDGTAWVPFGSSISTGECQYSDIEVASDGTPYVAFIDNGLANGTVTVLKHDGTGWVPLGSSATIGTGNCSYTSMEIGQNDTVFVAYEDGSVGGQVSVQKFDGTNWVSVGSSFLSQPFGSAYDVNLAFDHNYVPYVAYWNPAPMGPKASVHMFDGNAWTVVGTPSFTTGIVGFTTLAFDPSNTPYLAFHDQTMGTTASVMKYDGSNWIYVGAAGFSGGVAAFTSIAIDGNGNPYVAFYDDASAGKTTVMKFTLCDASTPAIAAFLDTSVCKGDTVVLSVSGTLNDATNWYWYTGSCGGTLVDSGLSISVSPADTTTYYVRGQGACVVSGGCTEITVNIVTVPQPVITASGLVLTSSASANNQWLKNGSVIPGETSQTYTVTDTGWYQVMVAIGSCSNISDSVLLNPVTGIGNTELQQYLSISPVPVNDVLNVDINASGLKLGTWNLKVTDNLGRVVYNSSTLDQKNSIDFSHLAPGMYFMSLSTGSESQSFKIIKNNR